MKKPAQTMKVWAPFASRVDLVMGTHRRAMDPDGTGHFSVTPPGDPRIEAYSFSLDGAAPLPDPRSQRQPEGVHGPSLRVDHEAFRWTDIRYSAPPLSSAIVYEAHVGTFSPEGSFAGMAKHLDHLVDLGATHLELMPVASFSGRRGWGYDGVQLFAPHEAYGGPEGLKTLVNRCHEAGLAVILDVVYNHLGPEGNYLGRFGPYFTDRYRTPWGDAVNFDGPGADEVRRYFVDNALMWLGDYHIDGLRLDAVHSYHDRSALHFLEELSIEVATLEARVGRSLVLIAETDLNDPRIVTPREAGGYGIHAQWSDDFHHALHVTATGERSGYYRGFEPLVSIAKSLQDTFVFDGSYSPTRGRAHGRPVGNLSQGRFLGYVQNHDQVGNRAVGDRIGRLVDGEISRVLAGLVLTSPFVPMLFQGEEWSASTPFQYFTDHGDEGLGRAVSEGRRSEFADFGWKPEDVPDPQSETTFLRSKLNWDETKSSDHREVLDWYRTLIRLRRRLPDLTAGAPRPVVQVFEGEASLIVRRGATVIVATLSSRPAVLEVPRGLAIECASREVLLGGRSLSVPGPAFVVLA